MLQTSALQQILGGFEAILKQLKQMEQTYMKSQADLDAALAALTGGVQTLTTALAANIAAQKALLAAIGNGAAPADLSNEVQTVTDTMAAVGTAAQALADQTTADAGSGTLPPPTT